MRFLWNFFVRTAGTALALWLVTLIFSGVSVSAPDGASTTEKVLIFLGIAIVIGFVNAVFDPILQLMGLPITFLTLGLFALIINGIVFWLAEPVSNLFGLGLDVNGFWAAVWGAILLSVAQWLVAPLTGALQKRGI